MVLIDKPQIVEIPLNCFILNEKINEFQSTVLMIDDFLKNESIDLDTMAIAKTTIFYDKSNKKILGFYTLNTSTVQVRSKLLRMMKRPRTRADMDTFPAIHISYFAIAKEYQSKGYGRQLMDYLFEKTLSIYDYLGFSLITVESLNNCTDFYEKQGFSYLSYSPDQATTYEASYKMYIDMSSIIDAKDMPEKKVTAAT